MARFQHPIRPATLRHGDLPAADALWTLAMTDPLTGLPNRRQLEDLLEAEWMRCGRDAQSLAVLMIDIDHFKAINDRLGHPAGDACLVRIADLLRQTCSQAGGLVGRWGGEEFLAVLPETDGARALAAAEMVVEAVRNHGSEVAGGVAPTPTTVSVGAASRPLPAAGCTASELVAAADRALYQAKRAGRDQAALAGGC
jgi:diguanylate cyclase (GGDEF)-like protein